MNLNSILEGYPVSILSDKTIFTILSYILNAGAISSKDLKETLYSTNPELSFDETTMIQMYKLNLIEKNKYNDWLPTKLSQILLSRVGISQKVSINILEQFTKNKQDIEWIEYAIEQEEDISVSIETYLKFSIADYLLKKYTKHKNIDEEIKKYFFHSIYFTCSDEFYILDKKKYLEKKYPSFYLSHHTNQKERHFQFYEKSNKYLIEFNELDSEKDDINQTMLMLNYSTRAIYAFITHDIDIGFKSMGIEKTTAILKNIEKNNKELYFHNITCSNNFSSKVFSKYLSEIVRIFMEDKEQKVNKMFLKASKLLKYKKDDYE